MLEKHIDKNLKIENVEEFKEYVQDFIIIGNTRNVCFRKIIFEKCMMVIEGHIKNIKFILKSRKFCRIMNIVCVKISG